MARPYYVQVSFPSDVGSTYAGVSRGPLAMLSAGLSARMAEAGYEGVSESAFPDDAALWRASIPDPMTGVRAEAQVLEANYILQQTLERSLLFYQEDTELWPSRKSASSFRDNLYMPPFHLVLGGDCSMAPAVMSAFTSAFPHSRIGLIYVDAHADAFVPGENGSTGILATMTLTHLTLRSGCLESMKAFAQPDGSPLVDEDNLVLFGLSTNEPSNTQAQLGWLLDQHFRTYTATSGKDDPGEKAQEAIKWLEQRVDMILVHFDLDTVDPGNFPLGNVPTWTGLEFEDVMVAIKEFLCSPKVMCLTLAGANPDRDAELRMTTRLVGEIAAGMKLRASKEFVSLRAGQYRRRSAVMDRLVSNLETQAEGLGGIQEQDP